MEVGGPQVGEVTCLHAPGGGGGNSPVHIISLFNLIGGVTRRVLPPLSGVPHLHVTKP